MWTSSTGRNNGYGGAGPLLRGSVVVSLRRMNRVLELDGELGYALVEPGVRWFDLHKAIEAAGHDLMLSIADLGWGGPVGNMLENGVTYLPYGIDWTRAVRNGGRAAERRGDADRHGGDARQPRVEPLQARAGPDARPAVHAIQLRDRHEARASG